MQQLPQLKWFSDAIEELERRVPPPQSLRRPDGSIEIGFQEKTLEQALLLKAARIVSNLSAGRLLLENGFLTELGALQRLLDETMEEVQLLAFSKLLATGSDLTNRVLSAFWEEEPTVEQFRQAPKNKNAPPRAKIIAELARITNAGQPDSDDISNARFLARTYSGFVHGSAPHLNMLFNAVSGRLQVSGIVDPTLRRDSEQDFSNHYFRGVICFALVAAALGCEDLRERSMTMHQSLRHRFHSAPTK